jgi:hypothetical protein
MALTVSTDRTAELLTKLEELVVDLTASEPWMAFLKAVARFHNYSPNNVLLILAQKPGATRCAGFNTWRSAFGRTVRKGERAIYVLGPCTRRIKEDDADGGERTTIRLTGFKSVATFDISQTDGEPLPEIVHPLLGSAPPELFAALVAFAEANDYRVEVVDQQHLGSANGRCIPGPRLIEISRDLSPLMAVKTAIHECSHLVLHSGELGAADFDRPLAELEAESVAYVVMQSIVCDGEALQSATYSVGYIAHWSGGGTEAIAGLRASADRISATARKILDSLSDADASEVPS